MIKCPYPQYTNIGMKKRLKHLCSSQTFPSAVTAQISFMLSTDYSGQKEDIEFVRDLVNASIVKNKYSGDLKHFRDRKLVIKIFEKIPMYYKDIYDSSI